MAPQHVIALAEVMPHETTSPAMMDANCPLGAVTSPHTFCPKHVGALLTSKPHACSVPTEMLEYCAEPLVDTEDSPCALSPLDNNNVQEQ